MWEFKDCGRRRRTRDEDDDERDDEADGRHAGAAISDCDAKKAKDMEIVKGAIPDLPRLPEWKAETAPLDLTDWLLTIEPAMGDLSDTSQQWWEQMLQSARSWYIQHQEKTPLEKVKHKPQVPEDLQHPRYQRLEK